MDRELNIYSNSKIYVLCPANNKTGGTELLHQLVFELNKMGRTAYIVYYFEGSSDNKNPTPTEFRKYIKNYKFLTDVLDIKENVLVLPEVCIGKNRKFKNIQKCVWWLSVDNYEIMKGKLNRFKKYGVRSFIKHILLNDYFNDEDLKKIHMHLYQSYFAKEFLIKKGISERSTKYLSDYINDVYFERDSVSKSREDIVIYNPKKGFEYTRYLIKNAPEIKFIPIVNMSSVQVRDLMSRAKIYIDFGNHPGKDRIPREAAISGCCIITNKRGSARFHDDVPIEDKYKFDDSFENIPYIISTIHECIKNYNVEIENFSKYRDFINKEKIYFKKCIKEIF
ncbi:hypothetical protein LB941_11985 [Ligilactobacillus sp. WILCCON 0076]|uniref:Glycosyltransferase n=1 Tax=Ligilactobacillus ubinensis TaxID=2876789 RepID=A0A9X2FLV4_9LACO|nr:hypothetical protein [Ligilactobacillus ubinensis]MCP0888049.1 hypothetical protein [Ligilactobacillus ubinensis]